jgi:hypothetical protein
MKTPFLLILFFFFGAAGLLAQKFSASADKTSIEIGDVIRVTYTAGSNDISGFKPPPFSSFRILSGPEISQGMQNLNGVISNSVSYSYALQALKKGKLTITPAHFRFLQKTVASNALVISVSQPSPSKGSNSTPGSASPGILMRTEVNKTHVVLGEAIAVNYKLYVPPHISLEPNTITKMPTTGFWVENGEIDRNNEIKEENYHGRSYRVFTIRKLILYPQRTGNLTVDPLEIECNGTMLVPAQKDPGMMFPDMFDNMFNMATVPFHKGIASDPVKITVDPLPEKNKPSGFSGMVGRAVISASVDKNSVKANEPVNFSLTLGGEGNITLQQAPKLNLGPDVEIYDPKITDKIDRSGNDLSGTRTFVYTLMPHKEGKLDIPSIPFSCYDPVKKTYLVSGTKPISLVVEKNEKASGGIDNPGSGENAKGGTPEYLKWLILTGIALLLLAAVLVFVRRKVKVPEHGAPEEEPFEEPDFNWYLNEAATLSINDPAGHFYSMILNALYGKLSQYLGISFSEITHENIREGLAIKNVSEALTDKYLSFIESCEMANYAPAGLPSDKPGVLDRCREIINELNQRTNLSL